MAGGGALKPLLVVLLPGNPGDAAFYDELVADLEGRGHEVVITSHPHLHRVADLLPYAEHHVAHAVRHLAARGRRPAEVQVVLVGHSVGAYLAYLIAARGLLPVGRLFMVFPFLARPTLTGRLILGLVTWPRLFAGLIRLLRTLPGSWRARLIAAAGAGELTGRVLAAVASPLPFAGAAMAQVERAEIAVRPDAGYLFDLPLCSDPARFAVLFCPGDRWVSAAVARQLAPFAHHFPPWVTHSLVVNAAARRLVTARLDELLVGRGAGSGP